MSATPKLTPADLSALMCARICHDLISPVGALGAAVEVLDDDKNSDMREDALDLIRLSSRQAAAKLQFLRLAFGAGGSAPGVIGVAELKALSDKMYEGGKSTQHWKLATDTLPKAPARLLLNLIMQAVMAIPRGGDIYITGHSNSEGVNIKLECVGPKARLADAFVRTLEGRAPEDGFDGRNIQSFYAGLIARQAKGKITAQMIEETVVFEAVLPANENHI